MSALSENISKEFFNLVAAYNTIRMRGAAAGNCPSHIAGWEDWTCCNAHRQLNTENGQLDALAYRYLKNTEGRYGNDEDNSQIFSPNWWTKRGMIYNLKRYTVCFPDARTIPLDFLCPDFSTEELLAALREFCPPDLRDSILQLSVTEDEQEINLLYADDASSGWLPLSFWGKPVNYSTP